jgi:hypothetical protein
MSSGLITIKNMRVALNFIKHDQRLPNSHSGRSGSLPGRACGVGGGQSGTRDWHNKPIGGRSAEWTNWTQNPSIPRTKNENKLLRDETKRLMYLVVQK